MHRNKKNAIVYAVSNFVNVDLKNINFASKTKQRYEALRLPTVELKLPIFGVGSFPPVLVFGYSSIEIKSFFLRKNKPKDA